MPSGFLARNLVMALSGEVPASSSIFEPPKKNGVHGFAGHVLLFIRGRTEQRRVKSRSSFEVVYGQAEMFEVGKHSVGAKGSAGGR